MNLLLGLEVDTIAMKMLSGIESHRGLSCTATNSLPEAGLICAVAPYEWLNQERGFSWNTGRSCRLPEMRSWHADKTRRHPELSVIQAPRRTSSAGTTCLIGENNTGKSNFLHAIRLCIDAGL